MFKKIIQTLANTGTVALLGYEIGAKQSDEHNTEVKVITEAPKVIIESGNHSETIIFGIVIIIIVLVAIFVYLLRKKRPLV